MADKKRKRPRGTYPQVYDGDWVRLRRRGYRMRCCDCSLVHRVNFRVIMQPNGRVVVKIQVFRDDRSTAACRRGKTIVIANRSR